MTENPVMDELKKLDQNLGQLWIKDIGHMMLTLQGLKWLAGLQIVLLVLVLWRVW